MKVTQSSVSAVPFGSATKETAPRVDLRRAYLVQYVLSFPEMALSIHDNQHGWSDHTTDCFAELISTHRDPSIWLCVLQKIDRQCFCAKHSADYSTVGRGDGRTSPGKILLFRCCLNDLSPQETELTQRRPLVHHRFDKLFVVVITPGEQISILGPTMGSCSTPCFQFLKRSVASIRWSSK